VSGIKENTVGNMQSVKNYPEILHFYLTIMTLSTLEKASVGLYPMFPGLRKKTVLFRKFSKFVHLSFWMSKM